MPVSFECINCKKPFRVSSKLAGKKIRCKGCNNVMRIPAPPLDAALEFDPSMLTEPGKLSGDLPIAQPIAVQPMAAPPISVDQQLPDDLVEIQTEWIVECDDCGRQHRPDKSLLGKRVKCKCGTILHLTENSNAGMNLSPMDPMLEPASPIPAANVQPGLLSNNLNQACQAPPPSFRSAAAPADLRSQRRREAEEMVRAADRCDRERSRRIGDDDDEEWGPMGKMAGGGAMILGGAIWTIVAYAAGYIFPYSFILMGLGAISLAVGLVESFR